MFGSKDKYSYFKKYVDFLNSKSLYPRISEIDGPSFMPEIKIKGEKYLSFSSNNYLGLAGDEKVKQITKEAIDEYGVGSGSTRLLSGTLDVQVEFEKKLAKFLGYEDSITFSSGFLANVGVIRMLVDPFPYFQLPFDGKQGVILSDELNHASIIDGVRLAKAERQVYKHDDMSSLEELLKKYEGRRILIISDGVFSMDGNLANIREITRLAKQYNALTFIDDSHGLGVLGDHGQGTHGFLGVEDVDVLMGSFTKAFGSIGGFVAINKTLGDYLRVTARSYIFSDPIPPAIVKGLIETLNIIENGADLRKNTHDNAEHLRTGLKQLGFTVLGHDTAIVPLLISDEVKAIEFSEGLFAKGILAPCIRQPAVPVGKERIRFSVTANHTKQDVDRLLASCKEIGIKIGLIK